jgi:amino acid transporter
VKRPLRLPSLLALGVNGIVGVGIFFAPNKVAAAVPGWRGVWAYVAVTVLLVPTGLVFARLGRAFPEDGGPYLYARAAFGPRTAFAVGWITYVSALFSTAAVLVGLVDATAQSVGFVSSSWRLLVEIALLTVLMGTLSRGLRLSALMWTAVTVLKSLPLVALPLAALFASGGPAGAAEPPHGASAGNVTDAALLVLFALQGFEVVPLPGAQVENAARNVPLATIGSLLFAGALYAALHASCLAALPDLAKHELPLADAAGVFGGATLRNVVIGATSLSSLGVVIGMLAMTPRYLAPLGSDDALGFRLDEQTPRAVPQRAFVVTYAVLLAMVLANAAWGSVGHLLELAGLSVTLQYGVTAAALFALASRGQKGLARADRWSAPFALLSCALFLVGAKALEIPVVLAMLALGVVARALRGVPRAAM